MRLAIAIGSCGVALLAGCRGGSGGGELPIGGGADFQAACEDACRAMYSAPCQGIDASQCRSGCAAMEDALSSACLDEQADLYDCGADLSYECTADGPMPTTTACVEEAMAFGECMQEAPCRGECAAAATAGCGGASTDACVSSCQAELDEGSSCDWELEDLYECHDREGLRCVDGEPASTEACREEALEHAECVAWDEPCRGYCLAVLASDCAAEGVDACTTSCETDRDPSCSSQEEMLYACIARDGISCDGAAPAAPASCSSEQESLDACRGGA